MSEFNTHDEWVEYCLNLSQLATLGVLSGAIMHDIRNGLTIISGNVQLLMLKKSGIQQADMLKRMETITGQIDRIERALRRVENFLPRADERTQPAMVTEVFERAMIALKSYRPDIEVVVDNTADVGDRLFQGDNGVAKFVLIGLLITTLTNSGEPPRVKLSVEADQTVWTLNVTSNFKDDSGSSSGRSFEAMAQTISWIVTKYLGGELVWGKARPDGGWLIKLPFKS